MYDPLTDEGRALAEWHAQNANKNFLREINHDQKTPKNQKKVRQDGFYEASEADYKDFWENEDTTEMLTE